jgi:hypothetical protein
VNERKSRVPILLNGYLYKLRCYGPGWCYRSIERMEEIQNVHFSE